MSGACRTVSGACRTASGGTRTVSGACRTVSGACRTASGAGPNCVVERCRVPAELCRVPACRVVPELCWVMLAELESGCPNGPAERYRAVPDRCRVPSERCRLVPELYRVTPDSGPNRFAPMGHESVGYYNLRLYIISYYLASSRSLEVVWMQLVL